MSKRNNVKARMMANLSAAWTAKIGAPVEAYHLETNMLGQPDRVHFKVYGMVAADRLRVALADTWRVCFCAFDPQCPANPFAVIVYF